MRVFILLCVCAAILTVGAYDSPAAGLPGTLEIGLLLVAIDVRPDHLRISEGLRISNPGPPQTREIIVTLPRDATSVTFHRGLNSARGTPDGFSAPQRFPTGVTEIAYSYALAVGREAVLSRTFPLPARRVEIVIRGSGVQATVRDGVVVPPAEVGGERLQRWEVRDLPAAAPLVMSLRGLPTRRTWIPIAAAVGLAAVLSAGLLASLRRRESSGSAVSSGSSESHAKTADEIR